MNSYRCSVWRCLYEYFSIHCPCASNHVIFLHLVCFPEKLSSIVRKILVDKNTLVFSRRGNIAWKYVRGFHLFKLGSRFIEKRFYLVTHEFDNYKLSGFSFEFVWYFYVFRFDIDVYGFPDSDNNLVSGRVRAFRYAQNFQWLLRDYCSRSSCFSSNLFISSIWSFSFILMWLSSSLTCRLLSRLW